MTKKQQARIARLAPNGIPRWIRCYDNGGKTADRYCCVFTGRYTHKTNGSHFDLCMSADPFCPQGVGMTGESDTVIDSVNGSWGGVAVGKKCHLGTRILFKDLPEDCKKCVWQLYASLWEIPNPLSIASPEFWKDKSAKKSGMVKMTLAEVTNGKLILARKK